jgi:hypothetical protein
MKKQTPTKTKVKAPEIDNKPLKLEDLIPQESHFTIGDKLYNLRKINLRDEAWLEKYHPNMQALFNKEDYAFMCQLAYRLMCEADQAEFEGKSITEKNTLTGEPETIKLAPYEAMLLKMSGPVEKQNLMVGILATIGISRPVFDAMVDKELKKNGLEK